MKASSSAPKPVAGEHRDDEPDAFENLPEGARDTSTPATTRVSSDASANPAHARLIEAYCCTALSR